MSFENAAIHATRPGGGVLRAAGLEGVAGCYTLRGFGQGAYSPAVAQPGDRIWRSVNECKSVLRFFAGILHPQSRCYGGCAWEAFGSAGYSFPVRQPAYSCHLIRLATIRW